MHSISQKFSFEKKKGLNTLFFRCDEIKTLRWIVSYGLLEGRLSLPDKRKRARSNGK